MQRALLYCFACLFFITTKTQAQVPVAQIKPSQCGSTLTSINSLIYAVCQPQTTAYRFEVTDTSSNVVQVIDRGLHYFSLNMLSSYDYSTTYSIRVELQINGTWTGSFGDSCLVSSPNILSAGGAAQVSSSQCGFVLPNINTLISTTSLQGVTGYRFRVTNITDVDAPNQVQIIDRGLQWFSLPMLSTYNYATTYMVEVAVKTTGNFSTFGSPCQITSPYVPSLTTCGETITDSATMISVPSLTKVSVYRFEVTNLETGFTTTIDRLQNRFSFDDIPDYTSSTLYGVRVAVMTSGVFSPFGDACEIGSPGEARIANAKEPAVEPGLSVRAYPNPFNDSFSVDIKSNLADNVNIKVYDMTGRLLETKNFAVAGMESNTIGNQYPPGVYNVIVSQGAKVNSLRVVKR